MSCQSVDFPILLNLMIWRNALKKPIDLPVKGDSLIVKWLIKDFYFTLI